MHGDLCLSGFLTVVLTLHSAEKARGPFPGRAEIGVSAEGPGNLHLTPQPALLRACAENFVTLEGQPFSDARGVGVPSVPTVPFFTPGGPDTGLIRASAGRGGCGWLPAASLCPGLVLPASSEGWASPAAVGARRTHGAPLSLVRLAPHTRLSLCRRERQARL